jgi:gas vesicle protein
MTTDRIYYSKDAEMHAMRRMTIRTVLFLAVGLGIGAVLALLLSPSSGKKIRQDLVQTVEEGFNNRREAVEPIIKRVEDQIGELRTSIEDRVKASFHPN